MNDATFTSEGLNGLDIQDTTLTELAANAGCHLGAQLGPLTEYTHGLSIAARF